MKWKYSFIFPIPFKLRTVIVLDPVTHVMQSANNIDYLKLNSFFDRYLNTSEKIYILHSNAHKTYLRCTTFKSMFFSVSKRSSFNISLLITKERKQYKVCKEIPHNVLHNTKIKFRHKLTTYEKMWKRRKFIFENYKSILIPYITFIHFKRIYHELLFAIKLQIDARC